MGQLSRYSYQAIALIIAEPAWLVPHSKRAHQLIANRNHLNLANCKCKLASAGEGSWRKGFSEFQFKKAKQYEPCEHA